MSRDRRARFAVPLTASAVAALLAAAPLAAQTHRGSAPERAARAFGFGYAVAMSAGEVFIGRPALAPAFPMPPSQTGGVHVFRQAGGAWTEIAHLTPADAAIGDAFGKSVAVDGNLLVVGAPGRADGAGAVYVFERDGGRWDAARFTRLTLANGQPGDALGEAVAVKGGVIVAGAPGADSARGAAHAWRRVGGSWQEDTGLQATGSEAGSRLGAAVAFDGSVAAVGAPGPDPLNGMFGGEAGMVKPGAVYLFSASGNGWQPAGRLAADSARILGYSVTLAGDALYAGAPGTGGHGAVYAFARDAAGNWTPAGHFAPDSLAGPAAFGSAVARAGDDVLASAPTGGAVWVYRRAGAGTWHMTQQLRFSGSGMLPFFGWAIATGANTAVIGVPGGAFFEGTAQVYTRGTDGKWAEAATVVTESGAPPAVTGGEVKCAAGRAAGFDCSDVDLLGFLPVSAVGGQRGVVLNDLWGWTDSETGREYALVGRFDGTAFVDVTDPNQPVYLGSLPKTDSAQMNVWRDIKTYKNHAFIVSDGAGPHGMQVFDLTRLRHVTNPPQTFTEDAHYDRIHSAHNIVIDTASGYAYAVGSSMGGETCGGALHMIDIRDPEHPTFAGCYGDTRTGLQKTGYTHDAQCVMYHGPDTTYQGREICFNSSETALGIADVTDKADPKPISYASYPNVAYSHQGWLTEDQKYFFMDDEEDELAGSVPKTRTIVWDVQDLKDPVVVTEFLGTTSATDHNLYIKGHYMYQSDYVAGLRVIDIADPAHPKEVGYFDTVAGPNTPGFAGSWSNYPFFKSGTILVSSMWEGLFLLKKREQTLVP